MSEDSKLSELRNKIDAIDQQLLKLLAERSDIVLEVGKHKGDNNGNNFIRSGREAKMIRDLTAQGAGKFPKAAVRSLWRSIISASLSLESGLKIIIPEYSNLHMLQLVIDYFGGFSKYKEVESEDAILDKIDKNTVGICTLNSGWWLKLGDEKYKHLKIFAMLDTRTFAVAKLQTEPSGDDRTLVITKSLAHHGNVLATHGHVDLVELKGFHEEVSGAVVIGHYGV